MRNIRQTRYNIEYYASYIAIKAINSIWTAVESIFSDTDSANVVAMRAVTKKQHESKQNELTHYSHAVGEIRRLKDTDWSLISRPVNNFAETIQKTLSDGFQSLRSMGDHGLSERMSHAQSSLSTPRIADNIIQPRMSTDLVPYSGGSGQDPSSSQTGTGLIGMLVLVSALLAYDKYKRYQDEAVYSVSVDDEKYSIKSIIGEQ